MIRIKEIDNTIEERILTGAIISTQFLRNTKEFLNPSLFVVPFVRKILFWCLEYFNQYEEAPNKHIQDIYNSKKQNIKEEEQEIITAFLVKLSSQYENEKNFNVEYLIDQAITYLKKRNLQLCTENINSYLSLDKIEEAENELMNFHNVQKITSQWIDPLSEEEIKDFFYNEIENTNRLFHLPGKIGEMLGPFETNQLFGVFGPAKRGKTFWLQEIAISALLEKQNVVFVSLEMNSQRTKRRIYRRLTAYAEEEREYVYPCFDCTKNQEGSCLKKERKSKVKLLNREGKKPRFDPDMEYKPCTICRGKNDFIPATWFCLIKRNKMRQKNTLKTIKAVREMYGNRFRFKAYPAFSTTINQLKNDLDILEKSEGFIPRVIAIDYADILAPEDSRVIGRERLDETWKTLKNLADSKHCLVITASQTNRGSFDKKNVTQTDVSEDIRKIAHIDGGLSLNQLPEEKRSGIMRVALIAGREIDFDQFRTCIVLENRKLGQVLLDSEESIYTDDEEN